MPLPVQAVLVPYTHDQALRHVAFEDMFEPVLRRRRYDVDHVQAGPHALSEQARLDADLLAVLGGLIGVGDIDVYPWLGDGIAGIRLRLGCRRPLPGLCLGAQLMAAALGARCTDSRSGELTLTASGRSRRAALAW